MKRAYVGLMHSLSVSAALVMTAAAVAQDAKSGRASVISLDTAKPRTHQLVVQVNANDPALMNLALNNVANIVQFYEETGDKVDVEVVAFGPGLHMLRDDTSPVKNRIKAMSESTNKIKFSACGNTRDNMTKVESREIPLVSQATVVKAGAVRIMELQEQGWSYLRP